MSNYLAKIQFTNADETTYFQYKYAGTAEKAASLIESGYDVYLIKDPATAAGKPTLKKLTMREASKSVSVVELLDGTEVVATARG